MKTTDVETSKGLAAALTGAGYEFEINFRTSHVGTSNFTRIEWNHYFPKANFSAMPPTFTMCQLWEMLPFEIEIEILGEKHRAEIELNKYAVTYVCEYKVNSLTFHWEGPYFTYEINPCNAFVDLAIWCIENNHPLNLNKKELQKE